MNNNPSNPRFEFRVFGQDCGRAVEMLGVSPPAEASEETLHTYLLSATNQHYNIKIRGDRLDTKVLLCEYQGLERWHPYLQLAFPLTSAFLHEFLFAWLEIDPPLLRRSSYTMDQFWQELMIPHPHLRTVQVCKKRRHYPLNNCQVEVGSVWIDDRHSTQTVAVEAVKAEDALETIELLGLQAADNTNYLVGLNQLLGKEAPPKWVPPIRAESFMPAIAHQLVLTR